MGEYLIRLTQGEYVHVRRRRLGLTQAKLAKEAKVGRNTIEFIERDLGKRKTQTINMVLATLNKLEQRRNNA